MHRQSLIFLVVLAGFSLACGLLDDDATNVSYTEQIPYSFDVDANNLCPQSMDCSQTPTNAPADQELQPIEFASDVDIVEETGNEKLRDFTGVFRSIEVTRIDYKVEGNDLTFDLPPTTLFIGPKGAQSKDDEDVVELATIPTVPAGENKSGAATVSDEGRSASADVFQNLKFAAVVYATPMIKQGQQLPPSGNAKVTLTIHVKFTANPQDAVN